MKPRLVVKVGTSTLLEEHELPTATFDTISASIKDTIGEFDVILVTSGATGFGVRHTSLAERPQNISQLQALASIGQVGLMERWRTAMGAHVVGQVLVTARELSDTGDSRLLLSTFEAMWGMGAIPIVNENDAVTNEEFTFGDNDKLSALVASLVGAQYLILLTDQDGIYENFGTDNQRRLEEVKVSDADNYIVATKSAHGTGGMQSKVMASMIALQAGTQPFIANARDQSVIQRVLSGESGTKLI
jgi:glutamate 5-kinase